MSSHEVDAAMPSPTEITVAQFSRLIGLPGAPEKATPFDTDGAFWSDRGSKTTFDVMLEEFGLATEPLLRLALIVRGADAGQLDLTPQSPGLLAACLGYFRMYRDDLVQLDAAMAHFD